MSKVRLVDYSGSSSFQGVVINTSVSTLIKVLGEPQYVINDGEDKVNYMWDCENSEGKYFSIYDWKEGRPIGSDEIIEFHIGSESNYNSMLSKTELLDLML